MLKIIGQENVYVNYKVKINRMLGHSASANIFNISGNKMVLLDYLENKVRRNV